MQDQPEVGPIRNTRNGNPEHWMPANKRRELPLRPKRGFESLEAAREYCHTHPEHSAMVAYQCSECGEYHLASRFFRGEDRGEKPGSFIC